MSNKDGKLAGPVINGIRTDLVTHAANYKLHNKLVRNTADQHFNNTTTLANVTDLLMAIGASEVWLVEFFLYVYCANSGRDIKVSITTPSGATQVFGHVAEQPGGSVLDAWATASGTATTGVDLSTTESKIIHFKCIVVNSTTAGNVQLQAAQQTAVAENVTIKANSCLIAHRVN